MPNSVSSGTPAWSTTQVVDAEGIVAFHHAFGGSNAIHVDVEAAKAHGGLVQHGIRTLFPIIAHLLALPPSGAKASLRADVKFLSPVRPGETITSVVSRSQSEAASDNEYELSASNGAGVKVLAGSAAVKWD